MRVAYSRAPSATRSSSASTLESFLSKTSEKSQSILFTLLLLIILVLSVGVLLGFFDEIIIKIFHGSDKKWVEYEGIETDFRKPPEGLNATDDFKDSDVNFGATDNNLVEVDSTKDSEASDSTEDDPTFSSNNVIHLSNQKAINGSARILQTSNPITGRYLTTTTTTKPASSFTTTPSPISIFSTTIKSLNSSASLQKSSKTPTNLLETAITFLTTSKSTEARKFIDKEKAVELPTEATTTIEKTADKNEEVKSPGIVKSTKVQPTLIGVTATFSTKPAEKLEEMPPVIVTALLDIGRGDWERFTRPFDVYLESLNHLIRMPNPIIVFGNDKVAQYIKIYPKAIQDRIQFIDTRLKDLPFYSYRQEIGDILKTEQENWPDSWPERFKTHPEAWSADYNIVVNSKSYFMYKATVISKFKSEFFAWVDAGYSHGERSKIPFWTWRPKLTRGKITLIKVSPPNEKPENYEFHQVYRQTRDILSGGVLAGDVATIKRFHAFFMLTFTSLLDQGKVDDDQTTLLFTIKNYRSTFNILHGGWLDAFKVIPREPYQRRRKRSYLKVW
ncbi:unnamed protein product [Bursaphelenchus okinawaensis]|uniref:Uncharacterized protein n=1 Tax=Bursaphelenchus okinawaensis TaxID=465554 RepID=A0A811KN75_9BILA|nr:unnamed protein product [Bursaphelenchus okinawaensis]CAG9107072.1 unnamed protein product [Bursaphelenchus okinawaensis]